MPIGGPSPPGPPLVPALMEQLANVRRAPVSEVTRSPNQNIRLDRPTASPLLPVLLVTSSFLLR